MLRMDWMAAAEAPSSPSPQHWQQPKRTGHAALPRLPGGDPPASTAAETTG